MKPDVAPDDFVAESLAAEKAGGFVPYFGQTRPAARRLVRSLLAGGRKSATATAGMSVLDWIGAAVAPLLGGGGVAALTPFASAAAGAAGSPLGVLAAAVSNALGKNGEEEGAAAEQPTSTASVRQTVTLRFRSAVQSPDLRWQANLCIPVVGNGSIVVRLVTPRQATGTFHFCGISTPIEKGRGEIPLPAIRAGLSRGGVAFARPGATPVPGAPFLQP